MSRIGLYICRRLQQLRFFVDNQCGAARLVAFTVTVTNERWTMLTVRLVGLTVKRSCRRIFELRWIKLATVSFRVHLVNMDRRVLHSVELTSDYRCHVRRNVAAI